MEIMDFVTWEFLATFAGSVIATTLIVQFTKGLLDKLVKIPTDVYVYVVALVVLVASNIAVAQIAGIPFGVMDALLLAINAVFVSLAAIGAYNKTFLIGEMKNEPIDYVVYEDEPHVEEQAGEEE